jgi:LysR family glycine cleavage system transcriptional activator
MPIHPPRPRPLPLNALRAFEAAARHGGFLAAAEELGVTAGAVAAQVKALEERLGAPLFHRHVRGVTLRAEAAAAAADLTRALAALAAADGALLAAVASPAIRVATLPAIAHLWLSPRLTALRAAGHDLRLSILAMEAPPEDGADLCLFPGARGEVVATDALLPVCAPALAAGVRVPEDLRRAPILRDAAWASDWDRWCAVHAPGLRPPAGQVFSLYAVALDQCIAGAGVLMGHRALIAPHLAEGRLVAPLAGEVGAPALRAWGTAMDLAALLRSPQGDRPGV